MTVNEATRALLTAITQERRRLWREGDVKIRLGDGTRKLMEEIAQAERLLKQARKRATEALYRHPRDTAAELKRLKEKMADAHPDRGGSSAAFIAARQRYVDARRRAR